jgi:hypothetical protein
MPEPLIITYTNLLHKYRGPDAEQVKAFFKKHEKDAEFARRAKILNKMFKLKAALVK